jgi:hypothetical protein
MSTKAFLNTCKKIAPALEKAGRSDLAEKFRRVTAETTNLDIFGGAGHAKDVALARAAIRGLKSDSPGELSLAIDRATVLVMPYGGGGSERYIRHVRAIRPA